MKNYTEEELQAATEIFDYLAKRDTPGRGEAAIGFGHFDMKIPDRCARLYESQLVPCIIYTGGIGAGTADLGMPEADAFLQYTLQHYPETPEDAIITESRSANTGENLRFVQQQLREKNPGLDLEKNVKRVLIVANAYRQLRVWLTCRKLFPKVQFVNCPPVTTFKKERHMFAEKGEDLVQHLKGEIERLQQYPEKGWIEAVELPLKILEAYRVIAG